MHDNELYVVVVKLLDAFMFLTSMDNFLILIFILFVIRCLNAFVNKF
jgi:hypothetical protein